ncbi:MAG TPA: VCBS repeat-containing protein [Herpetosiphonaceae bacterium]
MRSSSRFTASARWLMFALLIGLPFFGTVPLARAEDVIPPDCEIFPERCEPEPVEISGRVTTPAGTGVGGVVVTVRRTSTGVIMGSAITDANGFYFVDFPVFNVAFYTITPSKPCYRFDPPNRSTAYSTNNANFTAFKCNPSSDFDGDGKADVAVWRPSNGTWYILRSSNGTYYTQQWGQSGDRLVPGDYDGDGKTDLAVFRPGTSADPNPNNGIWHILRSSDGTSSAVTFGYNSDVLVPGDYDGDGKTDLATWRPSDGNWYVLQSSNGIMSVVQWGLSGDRAVPADYDGDGRTDRATWRPGDTIWYVLQSSTLTAAYVPWGLNSDQPVPADYDGDGKTDFATWRPSDTTWYILYNSTLTAGYAQWGLSGDVLTPGDYDGDGKTDVAVFRPSNGNWYILYSSNNAVVTYAFGTAGDIPVPSANLP